MQSEKTNTSFQNFAIAIPQTATYLLSGCAVMNATKEEWNDFKVWFDKEGFLQLGVGQWKWDIWGRHNDLVVDGVCRTLQGWFNEWKKRPLGKGFSYSFHSFKK